MTYVAKPGSHLVERAVEALGLVRPGAEAAGAPHAPAPAAPVARAASPVPAAAISAPSDTQPAAEQQPAPIDGARLRQAGLVAGISTSARSRASEEISLLQNQLMRTMRLAEPAEGHCPQVILVTSARPGEGKTFVSLNIAASLAASSGMPVLLVDTDGKHGSVSNLLGLAGAPGLRLLAGANAVPDARTLLQRTAQPRLFVLPYGAATSGEPAAPAGTFMATAILRLARTLPEHIIVLDSPPCLSTSDPSGLAGIAGQVLMVVQAERTQRAELEAALDLVDDCPVLQLVLNQTQMTSSDSFGASRNYGDYGAQFGATPDRD